MNNVKIAIIGAGNMGASLVGGLIANHHSSSHIWMTDTDQNKLLHLKKQFNIQTTQNNLDAVNQADVIILAVKPQIFASVAKELAASIQQQKPLIISIAAGVREDAIQSYLGENIPIVRAMPNTPALIQCGATALFC